MAKKFIFFIIFFYFLTLVQASFLPHLSVLGIIPNVVLILVFLLNIFEETERVTGLILAVISGLFLDIFSSNFIGFYVAISLFIALFLKYILRKHIKMPAIWT